MFQIWRLLVTLPFTTMIQTQTSPEYRTVFLNAPRQKDVQEKHYPIIAKNSLFDQSPEELVDIALQRLQTAGLDPIEWRAPLYRRMGIPKILMVRVISFSAGYLTDAILCSIIHISSRMSNSGWHQKSSQIMAYLSRNHATYYYKRAATFTPKRVSTGLPTVRNSVRSSTSCYTHFPLLRSPNPRS